METFEYSEEQIEFLRDIYTKRKRLLLGTIVGAGVLFLRAMLNRRSGSIIFDAVINGLVVMMILGSALILYFRKVVTIKKDLSEGKGIICSRVISRKSHFEHTDEYYLFFDDINLPNKEVSLEEYNHFSVGDTYNIPQSRFSKIVLDEFCNYQLF